MKKSVWTGIVITLFLGAAAGTTGQASPYAPVLIDYDEVTTTNGTMIRTSTADPCVIYRNGKFTMTMTGTSRIAIVQDADINKLTTAAHSSGTNIIYDSANDANVEATFGTGATLNGTWSPEIHVITEEDLPGYGGVYMFFAIKQKLDSGTNLARNCRAVIMKSPTANLREKYVHPITAVQGCSQTLLDKNGDPVDIWNIGMSLLRIKSGAYKGLYATFVDEVGRGEGAGKFYQRIRIAKLKTPWQLASDLYTVTTPTQAWEKLDTDGGNLPEVVEGGTAVYGKNGEVYLVYCGSGYWSEYGLGQLTLKRQNGDYLNPLEQSSWVKYENNPIFTSKYSSELRGAGHAFFLNDDRGNGFFVYHAYPTGASARNAYIEPYEIDYSKKTATSPDGLIIFGQNKDGRTAPVSTTITFYKKKIE